MKKLFTILFVLSAYVSFGQAYIGQDGAIHPTGKFPVIFSNEAKGSIKRVKSLTDRDAIAQNLRDTGMLCWVTDSSRFYVLSGGTSNTRWINFSSATGGGTGIGNELDPVFTQSPSFPITNEKKAYWDLVGLMMRIDSARKEMHDTAVAHDVIFDPNTFFYRNDTLSIIFPQDQTGGSNVTQEQIDLWSTILDTSLHPSADTIRAWIAKIKLNDTIYLDKNGFSGFGETSNDPVKNKAFTSFLKINDSTIRFWTGDSLFQDLAIKDILGGNSSDTAIQSIAMLSDSTGFRVFKKTGFYDVFLKGTRSGSGGSGTVTNVSVVNTFGVSGTVTNPTTTPALTLAIDTTKFVTTHQLNLVVNNFADSLSTIRNYIDTNISNIQNQVTNITNGSAGTVKSVSVVNTFGLTGTVTNPTTTPAITLTIDSTKYSTVSNVNTSIKNVVNNFGDSIANVKNIINNSAALNIPFNGDSGYYIGGDTIPHRLPVAPATSDSIDYAFTAMTTVYNEAGPGEYVSSAHGLTANKDNFNFPFRQLKSFDIGTWTDGDYISFNNATIASSTNFTFLRAFIRLKSVVPVSGTISFAFYYNGTQVSKTISCVNYGIDKSKVGVYQNVSIPFSAFGFTANNFDELRLKFGGTQSDGIYMDLVQFQNASPFENTFITDQFKKPGTDSVFIVVGGINKFVYRDSAGGASVDTQYLRRDINLNTAAIASNTTAITTKEPIIAAGATSQYWRGDKTWQTFPTIPTNNNQLSNGSGYISNITGLVSAGTNTTVTGSGTSASPYVISSTASVGGSSQWTTVNTNDIYYNTGNVGIGLSTAPTSKLDITTNSLGATQTNTSGLALVNNTAATSSVNQISPATRWTGQQWNTTSLTSIPLSFTSYVIPVNAGTANGYLTFQAGSTNNILNLWANGTVGIATTALPSNTLEVNGTAKIATSLTFGANTKIISANRSVDIGNSNTVTASGEGAVGIGYNINNSFLRAVAIGYSSRTTADEQFVSGGSTGSNNQPINDVYFGTGPAHSNVTGGGVPYSINGSGAFGTDLYGGTLRLAGGKGTGNGMPGDVEFQTAGVGSTGSTLQTLTTKMALRASGGIEPPKMTTAQRDVYGRTSTVAITSGGTGYVNGSSTIFSGPNGLYGKANVTSGVITSLTLLAGGLNSTTPSITITGAGSGGVLTATLQAIPTGTTIFNSTSNQYEFYNGTAWVPVGGSGGGSGTTVVSYGKNTGGDSTVLILSDGTRYAAIDNNTGSGGGSSTITLNQQTVSYTLALSDAGKLIQMSVAGANTVTVPPNSSVAFPTGTQIIIDQEGSGQSTITAGAGVTIHSAGSATKTRLQYSTATLIKTSTDTWLLSGDIQ